jgi:excisionase family DNA binding protein
MVPTMAGDLNDLVRSIAREEALKVIGTQPETAVTVKTFALRMGVDEKTIRRLIDRGEIRAIRVGSTLRITSSELDRILRQGTP